METKPINGADNRQIFLKPSEKQQTLRIFNANCELNPSFCVKYYLIHTRSMIDYIIRQLQINYPDKIKGHHSYSYEACILYNTYDYSSNLTSTLEFDEPENEIMNDTEHGIIHVTFKTLPDLKRFMTVYLDTTIGSYL